MPIYEYKCKKCDNTFEKLIRNSDSNPQCPKCGGKDVEKIFSTFSSSGSQGGSTSGPSCGGWGI